MGLDYIPFTDIIAKKLRRREEPLEEKTRRLMYSLCSFAKERVNYVNDGLAFVKRLKEENDYASFAFCYLKVFELQGMIKKKIF